MWYLGWTGVQVVGESYTKHTEAHNWYDKVTILEAISKVWCTTITSGVGCHGKRKRHRQGSILNCSMVRMEMKSYQRRWDWEAHTAKVPTRKLAVIQHLISSLTGNSREKQGLLWMVPKWNGQNLWLILPLFPVNPSALRFSLQHWMACKYWHVIFLVPI